MIPVDRIDTLFGKDRGRTYRIGITAVLNADDPVPAYVQGG